MYEQYLRSLLAPLGLYDLSAGTHNAAELCALGEALDAVSEKLDAALRESVLMTAQDEGLARREALLAKKPARIDAPSRRAALAALFRLRGGSGTAGEVNDVMRGCGIQAHAQEHGGGVRVTFPGVVGIPADFSQIRSILLDLLPCHLETEFFFRYLTWAECESAGHTWGSVEASALSWEEFQCSVPEEA